MLINRKTLLWSMLGTKKEFDSGHIVDSLNIPLSKLKQRLNELLGSTNKSSLLLFANRTALGEAAKVLHDVGHDQVVRLSGGLSEWKAISSTSSG